MSNFPAKQDLATRDKFKMLKINFLSKFLSRIAFVGYLVAVVCLFLYSFTQVDLGLTLSRLSIWMVIQRSFQAVGYFNRPLSTLLYLLIISFLFIFYFLLLFYHKKIAKRSLWLLIILTAVVLAFSYNAFSYDLFNYIFDAKIVTFYHQNPYYQKALDYPQDPMLSFMHWTHRVYPYGPIWLALTIPLSFLGFQYFLPTLFLFKFLIAASYIGSVFMISRIIKRMSQGNEIFAVAFFALNPLVIVESLVSSHNDIVMIFFALLSIYLLMITKYVRSSIILIISILVKYSSILLFPIYLYFFILKLKKKNLNWERFFLISVLLMSVAIVIASVRTTFQPWYLLYVIPFATPIAKKIYIFVPIAVFSFFSLLQYSLFLYLGNWNPPVPSILSGLLAIAGIISAVFLILRGVFLTAGINVKIKG